LLLGDKGNTVQDMKYHNPIKLRDMTFKCNEILMDWNMKIDHLLHRRQPNRAHIQPLLLIPSSIIWLIAPPLKSPASTVGTTATTSHQQQEEILIHQNLHWQLQPSSYHSPTHPTTTTHCV